MKFPFSLYCSSENHKWCTQASAVILFFSKGIVLSNYSTSFAVEICSMCNRVSCFFAKRTAIEEDK